MIITLSRWINNELEEDNLLVTNNIMPDGYYESDRIRLDRIDKYAISDDKTEIILTIGGNEFFYDYCKNGHDKIKRYFDLLNTDIN